LDEGDAATRRTRSPRHRAGAPARHGDRRGFTSTFALPGVGRLVVDAVFARDYPLVQGVVLLIAVGFI
jgi:hypothetical protein